MVDYPYAKLISKIPQIFKKIKDVGIPEKATIRWLQSIGFKSTNDRPLLRLLKFIGFINSSSSAPTDDWKAYRGKDAKQILAKCIKGGYEDLFSTYPDAYSRGRNDLEDFFSTNSNVGEVARRKMVLTFQELCKLADFNNTHSQAKPGTKKHQESTDSSMEPIEVVSRSHNGLTVNINIQLTIPETLDGKVYDAFFSAMKKHLLQGGL